MSASNKQIKSSIQANMDNGHSANAPFSNSWLCEGIGPLAILTLNSTSEHQ